MDLVLCVEGDGDALAAPLLVRRILEERWGFYGMRLETQKRNGLEHLRARNWARFRRYLQVARIYSAPILWIVDLDDGCAWHVAEEMHSVATEEGLDVPFGGVLLVREYESIFLADCESAAKKLGADVDALRMVDPEEVRDAKGTLSRAMPRGTIYKASIHQEAITAVLDLSRTEKHSRSFQHLVAVIEWLIGNASGCYPIKAH